MNKPQIQPKIGVRIKIFNLSRKNNTISYKKNKECSFIQERNPANLII